MARLLPAFALALLTACGPEEERADAKARDLIRAHGCGTCHLVPGFEGHGGLTGPPLTAMSRQAYVAGVAANTPEALAFFIADPQAVDPRSAMPDLGVTPEEASTIAAYLYRTTR